MSNNFAFIDSQNLHLSIKDLGWNLDYKRFRVYLKEKYGVARAYLFMGYIPENKELYTNLQESGYVLVFKPVLMPKDGKAKGNVDADLVLQAMIDFPDFDKAVIVTSDGDFYSLVKYFYEKNKLKIVLSPNKQKCSILLKKSAKEKIAFLDNLKGKLAYMAKKSK